MSEVSIGIDSKVHSNMQQPDPLHPPVRQVHWGGTLLHLDDLPFHQDHSLHSTKFGSEETTATPTPSQGPHPAAVPSAHLPSMPMTYWSYRRAVSGIHVRPVLPTPSTLKGLPTADTTDPHSLPLRLPPHTEAVVPPQCLVPSGNLPTLKQLLLPAEGVGCDPDSTTALGPSRLCSDGLLMYPRLDGSLVLEQPRGRSGDDNAMRGGEGEALRHLEVRGLNQGGSWLLFVWGRRCS